MSDEFPIWKEKYDRMGVTPEELYLRQTGKCFIRPEVDSEGKVSLHCTDGNHKALTGGLLNPTYECMVCLSRFTENVIEEELRGNKPEIRKDVPDNNSK